MINEKKYLTTKTCIMITEVPFSNSNKDHDI